MPLTATTRKPWKKCPMWLRWLLRWLRACTATSLTIWNEMIALEPEPLRGFPCTWCDRVYTKKDFSQKLSKYWCMSIRLFRLHCLFCLACLYTTGLSFSSIRLTVCTKSQQAKKTKNMDRTFLIDPAQSKHKRLSQSRNKAKITLC